VGEAAAAGDLEFAQLGPSALSPPERPQVMEPRVGAGMAGMRLILPSAGARAG